MVIGISINTANTQLRTGVEWYVYHLVREMAKLSPDNIKFRLYVDRPLVDDFFPLPKNVEVCVLTWSPKILWTQLRLSYEMWRHPPDILFVPAHVIPLIHPRHTVMTVHDVAAWHIPEVYSMFERWYSIATVRYALQKSHTVIVPSQATEDDLKKMSPKHKAGIIQIPMGIDSIYQQPINKDKQPAVCRQYKITKPYIISIGRLEKKKNIIRILSAYKILREQTNHNLALVLIGKPGYGYKEIQQALISHPFKNDIYILGWIEAEHMRTLLSGAQLCLYPSLYEGFGLVTLEALAYGIPVVTSNVGSLAEIGSAYVVRVNPYDIEEIFAGIKKALEDKVYRADVLANGPKYSATFSWRSTAEKTLQLLKNVVS